MRMPRMTTRRWMIAVAALAITLGSYREASRLKRNRDEFLARAAGHLEVETYYRRLVSSAEASFLHRKLVVRESAAPELSTLEERRIALDGTVERWLRLATDDSTQAEEDAHEAFREAQARTGAMAERGQQLVEKNLQRDVEYHRRQADHHATLGRKYATAAAHPWLPVAPDPPRPN